MDIVVQRILKIGNRCKVSFQILKQHGKKSITQEAAAGKTAARAEHTFRPTAKTGQKNTATSCSYGIHGVPEKI